MMKYADSFIHTFVKDAAGTYHSPWYDISWANEISAYKTITFGVTRTGDETEALLVERNTPHGETTMITFTARTATQAGEEKWGSEMYDHGAPGIENKLGTKVRFELTLGGSAWTASQEYTVVCVLYAKRN